MNSTDSNPQHASPQSSSIYRSWITTLKAESSRKFRSLRDRIILPRLAHLRQNLNIPSLSSVLLYIQGVIILVYYLHKPISAIWYGTRLEGDRTLLRLYDEYIRERASMSSIYFAAAWHNDPPKKVALALVQFVIASVVLMIISIIDQISESEGVDEDGGKRKVKRVLWYCIVTSLLNLIAVVSEIRRAGDKAGSRVEEDASEISWERRGTIPEQDGWRTRGSGIEGAADELRNDDETSGLRASVAYAYPQYSSRASIRYTPPQNVADKERTE